VLAGVSGGRSFSAILPFNTVVELFVQDTWQQPVVFWNGVGWFKELLISSTRSRGRFWIRSPQSVLLGRDPCDRGSARDRGPLGRCRATVWTVAACLVILALPLLSPELVERSGRFLGRPRHRPDRYTLNTWSITTTLQRVRRLGHRHREGRSGTGPSWWRYCATPDLKSLPML